MRIGTTARIMTAIWSGRPFTAPCATSTVPVPLPGSGSGSVDVVHGAVNGLPLQMAVVVLAVLPILMVYPFVQRHFTKGVIFGAVKG